MNVYVNGRKQILSQKDFVAKGGEGSIYQKSGVAYKIYEDLKKMIPLAKIGELNVMTDPSIVGPQAPVYNDKKHLIGFTMDWLGDDKIALCKLFTNSFRDANGITPDLTTELVENIKLKNHYVHQNKCLIVDGNELNYMVAQDFVTPYFIDVNAWKTPSFEATAIMSSIRDWTVNDFNENTDWFSFAIVAFQLFVGIHPYKGKHKGYKKNDFMGRIKDGVSVFNSEVRLPPTVRDFNLIPKNYKEWFFKTFEHGNRNPPPDLPGQLGRVSVTVHLVQSTDNFEIRELTEFAENILYHNAQYRLTKTTDRIYIGKTDYKVQSAEVVFTPLEQVPILIKIVDNKVHFKALGFEDPKIDLTATDLMINNNILYLRNKERLLEMDFKVLGGKIHAIIKRTWNVEANSAKIFSGVIYQSALGSSVISIPLSTHTKSAFITKQIKELDEYQILDAKCENRICVLTGNKSGRYDRIIIIFDEKYDKYRMRIVKDIDFSSINFTTLDNGVCILITDDDAVEIFLNRIDKPDVKRIEDPVINSTMRLCKDGTTVKFFRDNKLYQIKMK
jgi:hypothetical protein